MNRAAAIVTVSMAAAWSACNAPPKNDADAGVRPVVGAPVPGGPELLDGLSPGSQLGGVLLQKMYVSEDHSLALDFRQGDAEYTLWIARKGTLKFLAPRSTDRFDIYYSASTVPVAPGAIEGVAQELERRVRRTEASAALPAGM